MPHILYNYSLNTQTHLSSLCLQCERKETFIQQIQSLDIETQAAIAGCIQQVLSRFNQIKHLQTPTHSLSILEEILASRDFITGGFSSVLFF